MNIAVCIKQTADTESRPTLAPDGSSVGEEGLVWIINPHDESAIEVAVRLRDEQGGYSHARCPWTGPRRKRTKAGLGYGGRFCSTSPV